MRDTAHRARAGLVAAAAALTGVFGAAAAAPTATAHDSVIDADPGLDASVDNFPERITLEFSGEPRPNFNTVAVSDAESGEVLFSGEPELDRRFVSIDVPADVDPGPGTYTVGFQITSSDGHSTRGKTQFTVVGDDAGAAGETGETADASDGAAAEEGPSSWLWIALGGVALLAVLGAVIVWFTRSRTSSDKEK